MVRVAVRAGLPAASNPAGMVASTWMTVPGARPAGTVNVTSDPDVLAAGMPAAFAPAGTGASYWGLYVPGRTSRAPLPTPTDTQGRTARIGAGALPVEPGAPAEASGSESCA